MRSLSRPEQGEVVEGRGGFGAEQRGHGAVGELGKLDRDEIDAHGAQLVEGGEVEALIVEPAGLGGCVRWARRSSRCLLFFGGFFGGECREF